MKRTAILLALAAIGAGSATSQFYNIHVGTDGVGLDLTNIIPVLAPPPPRVVHVPFVPGYVPPPRGYKAAKKAAKHYRKAAKHYHKAVQAWGGMFAAPVYYDYDDDWDDDDLEDYYKHVRKHYKKHHKKHHRHHGHHRHHHDDDDDDDD